MLSEQKIPNRLAHEKSPYLLQHAYNPVDWYPWGEEAFEKAKREDKPIFLSLGYSTCHWCHVIERESFEDEEVAAILNEGFVAVKVDREERPDLDGVYMNVCQALTGSGGWPLTVLLTPERTPFFAGTYFPKHARYGKPGLIELLQAVRKMWETERDHLQEAGEKILDSIGEQMGKSSPGEPGIDLLHSCYRGMEKTFDPLYGGFGQAPKFPVPHQLLFLLRYWKRFQEPHALEMAEKTLLSMYRGGIFDHIGFGFSRYSTDRKWLAPHFEKMLYDNALLSLVYLEAYQATGKTFYAHVSRSVFAYVLREMTSAEGGFYTAEDADSEGVEGKFYLWTPDQVKKVLGEDDGEFFCRLYGISEQGNFEGMSIPNLLAGMLDGGDKSGERDAPWRNERAESLRRKLFAAREKRIHPFKDDKILTSWNGLMIAALARGGLVLGEEKFTAAAEKAAGFLLKNLRGKEGRLLARYRQGEAAYSAYLDDYAFLVWGLLELYQATFKAGYLEEAIRLNREMLDHFWDTEAGGLFFTARDREENGPAAKEIADTAYPSGNSVAAWNLLRMARLTDNKELQDIAQRQLYAFGGAAARAPQAYAFYLCALDFFLGPPLEIVITAKKDDPAAEEMLGVLRSQYLPQAIILPAALSPSAAGKGPVDGRPAVYVCQNYACREAVTEAEELVKILQSND